MTRENGCRACRAGGLETVVSLGDTPLANRLTTRERLEEREPTYPLDLVFCTACTLLQITETVPPEILFRDYLYFSSVSDTVLENARTAVQQICGERSLGGEDLVIEIASNDGYLLQFYKQRNIPVLGIEPALNIAEVAQTRGIPTMPLFFGRDVARALRADGISASVVHANNVLAHVADLNGFVAGLSIILRERGVAVIEVPYVVDMVEQCEFDTIYHEHLCYFSLTALQRLFGEHRLDVLQVQRIPIHGGSLRITVGRGEPEVEVARMIEFESGWGVADLATYRRFAERIGGLGDRLRTLLNDLKRDGRRIAAYGASAKGSTLLNVFGIGDETLEYVVDRSEVKQGLYTPGTHLPIVSPDVLRSEPPDYLLLLTWNHAAEIVEQQRDFTARGGRFIIPVPEPRIV